MKKNLLLSIIVFFLLSCSNNDVETYTTKDIWVCGFKSFLPTSTYEKCDTKFLFFSTDNNPKFITKSLRAGNVIDFSNASDTIFQQLVNDDKITLDGGNKVRAIYSITVSASTSSYKTVSLPIGRYFVCAVCVEPNVLVRSRYYLKYCTQYIEVKERSSELMLSPVFPYDYSRYGLIPWTDWSERPSYTWTI